ncbi:hypothetical protein [Pandoraea sp.]|uniref:hypothetical protein n=1 Tax=Pandoraea sp. TaxID=1883445 RepID=UPI0035AEFF92
MTLSSLRPRAWIVPIALSLWAAGLAPACGATSATPETSGTPGTSGAPGTPPPGGDGRADVTRADDPASPDAPAGPPPSGVLRDFSRPALSVPADDWRMINASVSGGGHDMAGHVSANTSAAPSPSPHATHATHATHAAPTAPAAHGAHGAHGASPAAGAATQAQANHEAMGHAMPTPPPSGTALDSQAAPAGHDMRGGVR